MGSGELFWVQTEVDLPPDVKVPKRPGVWRCDMAGFHTQDTTVGWSEFGYSHQRSAIAQHDQYFQPFLLVRGGQGLEGQDARFCEDCADWLIDVFNIPREVVSG